MVSVSHFELDVWHSQHRHKPERLSCCPTGGHAFLTAERLSMRQIDIQFEFRSACMRRKFFQDYFSTLLVGAAKPLSPIGEKGEIGSLRRRVGFRDRVCRCSCSFCFCVSYSTRARNESWTSALLWEGFQHTTDFLFSVTNFLRKRSRIALSHFWHQSPALSPAPPIR